MSTLTLASFTPPNCQLTGTGITLRVYYPITFMASDGTLVVGSSVGSNDWFIEVPCTVVNDTLIIDSFDLITTDDPQPVGSPICLTTAVLYQNGAQKDFVWSNWVIPVSLAPTTNIEALYTYNQAIQLTYPQPFYLNRQDTVALILATAPTAVVATDVSEGTVRLSVPAGDAAHPVVLGQNDPAVGDVHGTFTANHVPRASDTKTLSDSQIEDDGTDISMQTLNSVQGGDYQVLQNGTFFSVNDSLTVDGGRATFQAGGDAANEYAGMSADCSAGVGEISIQTTGITHLYGTNQVTKVGDGLGEQNGTLLIVNDPTLMVVQTVTNQIPNDPSISNNQLCFFLDETSGKLKARIRLSDGTYATWEGVYTPD